MIKLENTEVMGWEAAIRGMRNPMNSWEKSDSKMIGQVLKGEEIAPGVDRSYWEPCVPFIDIGEADLALMKKLVKAGTDHRKFMRMITVYVDITAPLYWWKEFDTYKVGTVANSCSTMHKIADKEFTLEDFSCEHLGINSTRVLKETIKVMNDFREEFIKDHEKENWWQTIQLLPSSYNQRRTVMLNYEVLANIYKSRKNHKLDEWRELCEWIEGLPYSELITGGKDVVYIAGKYDILSLIINILQEKVDARKKVESSFWDDAVSVMDDMTDAQAEQAIEYLKQKLGGKDDRVQ